MDNAFSDKVTEYHIINAQLMSKAMALLDSANDFMADKTPVKNKYNYFDDITDTTLEYFKRKPSDDDNNKSPDTKTFTDQDDNVSDTKSEETTKNKFNFPINYDENKCNLLDDVSNVSFSETEDDVKPSNGIDVCESVTFNESENIVERLLNTKITVQKNGGVKSTSAKGKVEDGSPKKCSESKDDKTTTGCIKILRQQIEDMTEEIQDLKGKLKKRNQEYDDQSKIVQSLQDGKNRILSQMNGLKSASMKKDGRITTLNARIQALEVENKSIKNERDTLSKNTKEVASEMSSTEVRLTRALKEIVSLKEALNICKQDEKDVRESSRKEIDKLNGGIKVAEKRERTLLSALKKQALLIDNLKKQVNYLTSKIDVDNSEKQLDSILKWEHK